MLGTDFVNSSMPRLMKVVCISPRDTNKDQIQVGSKYNLDCLSIWIDSDGDTYGNIYDLDDIYIGRLKLSHFSSEM